MSNVTPYSPAGLIGPAGAPVDRFPWRMKPYNNITPFTYRDGQTYLDVQTELRKWLVEYLVPYIDKTIGEYVEAFDAALENVETAMDAFSVYIDGQKTIIDAKRDDFIKLVEDSNEAFDVAVSVAIGKLNTSVDAAEASAAGAVAARAAAELARDRAAQYASTVVAFQDNAMADLIGNAASAFRLRLENVIDTRSGGRVSVRRFGAKGDGVTDDSAAFRQAYAAAGTDGDVWVPPGRYVVSDVTVSGRTAGIPHRSIIIQGAIDKPVFKTPTDVEEVVGTVSADVARGAKTINVTGSTGTLKPGDWIVIYDKFIYDPLGQTTASGEIVEVSSVNGGVIGLRSQIIGALTPTKAYTLSNQTAIRKMNLTRGIVMDGLTFDGLPAATAPILEFLYTLNYDQRNVSCLRGGSNFIRCGLSVAPNFIGGDLSNLVDDITNAHFGYGIHLNNATRDAQIANVTSSNTRHAFTTTGGAKGVPARTSIVQMTVTAATETGIDSHSATNGLSIGNCDIASCGNGIVVRGRGVGVKGNRITQCVVGIRLAETLLEDITLTGNDISDGTVGIACSDPANYVTIQGGSIKRMSQYGIRFTAPVDRLHIDGVDITETGDAGILIDSASRGFIRRCSVTDACMTVIGQAIGVNGTTGVGRLDINNNDITFDRAPNTSRAVSAGRATTIVNNRVFNISPTVSAAFRSGGSDNRVDWTQYNQVHA